MKKLQRIIPVLILLSIAISINAVTVFPKDTKTALVNPDMGWVLYFYSNIPENYGSKLKPSDTVDEFPGVSTVYLRIPWAFVEPEEGKFNWSVLDTPMQRWIDKGKRIALCMTCSENWMKYPTPEWVKKAGAKGTFYQFGKGRVARSETWDPFFDDPVFLRKLEKFIAAVAARYDSSPNIAFVNIGTFGLWGEGHTFMSSRQDNINAQKKHIDLHAKYFKNSLLCISDDFAGHNKPGNQFPITDYAFSKGVTLRDDSILVQPPPNSWYHAGLAQKFWPERPVILEHEHYGGSVGRGAWNSELLLKAVEDYHASFMSIHWWPRIFLENEREIIDKINLRLGYRLQPVEVTWPKTIEIGNRFKVQWTWSNKGVAPCYSGGFPALTLKDDKGGIVSVLSDDTLNMRDLKVGSSTNSPITKHESEFVVGLIAPAIKPGSYDVFVSVGDRDGTPRIALPLKENDGHRRYKLGTIIVENRKESKK